MYLNYATDGEALIRGVFDQMNSFCTEECSECESPSTCTTCKDGFFYKSASCLSCSTGCLVCENATTCTRCSEGFVLWGNFSCLKECPVGYYVGNTSSCTKCPNGCSACINLQECSSCSAEYFQYSSQCLTACPQSTWVDSHNCSPCDQACDGCTGPLSSDCTVCKYPYQKVDGVCTKCAEKHFYTSGVCAPCHELCAECDAYPACSVCEKGLTTLTSGECGLANCGEGFYSQGYSCIECEASCKSCTADRCLSCKAGSQPNQGSCQCIDGYQLQDKACCISYTIEANESSEMLLKFSFPLDPALTAEQVSLQLDELSPSVKVASTDSSSDFSVKLNWDSSINKEVDVLVSVLSREGISICEDEVHLTFNLTKSETVSASFKESVSTTTLAVSSVSMMTSSMSGNPSTFFSMLNTLQILSLIPLMNVKLTEEVSTLLSGSNPISIVPNLYRNFGTTMQIGNSEPYPKAADYGYDTASFIYNIGQEVSSLLFALTILALLFAASRVSCCFRVFFTKHYRMTKASFVSQYIKACFIMLYLDAMVQFRSFRFGGLLLIINILMASSYCVFALILLYELLVGVKNLDLLKSFFKEVKHSPLSRLQPFILFSYQAIFVSAITLCDMPEAQLIICMASSACVKFI